MHAYKRGSKGGWIKGGCIILIASMLSELLGVAAPAGCFLTSSGRF
jgi:hypothetical protein